MQCSLSTSCLTYWGIEMHTDGLVQDCSSPSTDTLESCTKPLIYASVNWMVVGSGLWPVWQQIINQSYGGLLAIWETNLGEIWPKI